MEYQTKREIAIASVAGVVSFGAGAAAGYFYCAKKFSNELNEVRHLVQKLELFADQAEANLQNLIEQEGLSDKYMPVVDYPDEIDVVQVDPNQVVLPIDEIRHETPTYVDRERATIFPETREDEEGWDWDEELKNRRPDAPYVITKGEYEENEDYSESTLTFYEGDEVLCDEHDVPVYNPHTVAAPLKFGHGSGDPNIVYIRNDRLEAIYEVIRDRGHYATEVLGVNIDEDSFERPKSGLPKFREE